MLHHANTSLFKKIFICIKKKDFFVSDVHPALLLWTFSKTPKLSFIWIDPLKYLFESNIAWRKDCSCGADFGPIFLIVFHNGHLLLVFAQYKRAVHEGVKFPFEQCNHKATSKGSLVQHKRALHEGVKFPCGQCNHQATSKGHLAEHKRAVHDGVKYPCGQCNYRATSKGDLVQHKRAVHEGVKYPCGQCNYQATTKGNLAEHKRAMHEGVKYPCGQCNYQATIKGNLA